MATILQVGTAGKGGYQAPSKNLAAFVMANRGLFRFRQFAEILQGHGQRNGTSVIMPKWSDFSAIGTSVAETATMPLGTATVSTLSISVKEYGNSVDFSLLSRLTMNVDPEEICRTILARDNRLSMEREAEVGMDQAKLRYVGTSTAGYALTTNGTATATNTSVLNAYHVGAIRDLLLGTYKVPFFDAAGNYMAVVTIPAGRQVKNDATFESWKLYADPEALLAGEVGRLDGVRFVEANEAAGFDDTIGASNVTGEAYFFGADALYEDLISPDKILEDVSDYGRINGIAWHNVTGFGAWLDHIIKWCSA